MFLSTRGGDRGRFVLRSAHPFVKGFSDLWVEGKIPTSVSSERSGGFSKVLRPVLVIGQTRVPWHKDPRKGWGHERPARTPSSPDSFRSRPSGRGPTPTQTRSSDITNKDRRGRLTNPDLHKRLNPPALLLDPLLGSPRPSGRTIPFSIFFVNPRPFVYFPIFFYLFLYRRGSSPDPS